MNTRAISFILAGVFASVGAFAAAPAGAPAGSTGLCKDGSYATAAVKKGACKGHKGVKEWYAADAGAAAAAPAASATTTAAVPAAAPAASSATSNAMKMKKMSTPATTAAPGGGPGMVWANDTSKVYHCATDKWYGKTKHGEYLSEADAKAKGFKPEHGKTCQ